MILADTSVWVAHLKRPGGDAELVAALEAGVLTSHPFVEGELLLAGAPVGALLAGVEWLVVSPHEEVRSFVASLDAPLRGVGWVDVHLLHAALANQQRLLTRDRALAGHFARLARVR